MTKRRSKSTSTKKKIWCVTQWQYSRKSYLSLFVFASCVCVCVSEYVRVFCLERDIRSKHLTLGQKRRTNARSRSRRNERQVKRDARNRRRYVVVLVPHSQRSHSYKPKCFLIVSRLSFVSQSLRSSISRILFSIQVLFLCLYFVQIRTQNYFPSLLFFCGAKVVCDVCVDAGASRCRLWIVGMVRLVIHKSRMSQCTMILFSLSDWWLSEQWCVCSRKSTQLSSMCSFLADVSLRWCALFWREFLKRCACNKQVKAAKREI